MRSIFVLFAILLFTFQSFCSTIYTRCNGNWNDPNIWQGGVVPATGDSIYVINSVRLTSNLSLNNNYLNIASNANICGCYSFITNAGCNIVINGTAKFNAVTHDGLMTINGTMIINNLTNNGNIFIYGLLLVGWNCYCTPVINNCDLPVALFSASDTIICEGDCINFHDNSLHNPTSWNWQFAGSNTPSSNAQNPQNICYPNQGTYNVSLIASNTQGSDTLIKNLLITVKARSYSTISPFGCQSYMSPDGQHLWTSSGTYHDTIPNSNSCDSIITVQLTILNSSSTINPSSCQKYISPSGNYTWYNSGTYHDTIPNSVGCDSVITINLSILNSASTVNVTSCYSYTSPSGNYQWTFSGNYSDTIPNTSGCDSIITINLIIANDNASVIDLAVCGPYTSPSNNYTWTSTGIYSDTIPTAAGCDSLITINLVVQSASYSFINITACKSYLSPSGKFVWINSGIYLDTIPNILSCDSILTIDLIIDACESIFYIPNIFSPNGDGQNDILYIKGKHIEEIAFYIYDRWGENIFESNDINIGWDGTYKGKPMNEGVFTYYVKVKFKYGEEQLKQGNITLVR
jgi:gliding motility-associated-like protein